jgi:hypothetical protein
MTSLGDDDVISGDFTVREGLYGNSKTLEFVETTAESVLLQQILDEVREIRERMDNVEAMTVKVIAEVKPTLDEVMNSSFMKMLGMKKKS